MQPNTGSVSWGSLKKDAEDALRPLAAGTRVTTVVEEAEFKTASTGSLMVVAKMVVTEGPYANRKLFNNFVMTPDNSFAMNMFFKRMSALGADDAFFAKLSQQPGGIEDHLKIIANAIVGRKVTVIMGAPRAYQGVERDNPDSFEAITGQPPLSLTGNNAATGGVPVPGGTSSGTPAGPPTVGAASPPIPSSTGVSSAGAPPTVPSF